MSGAWEVATWLDVMEGDKVRLPGRPETAAEVETISPPQHWHTRVERTWTDEAGKPRDVLAAHEHSSRLVRLKGREGALTFPLDGAVEALMDKAFLYRRVLTIVEGLNAQFLPAAGPIEKWNVS